MRDDVERWLTHMGVSFKEVNNESFQFVANHYDINVEIFEPKAQSGVLVVGTKVVMKNKQIARYVTFDQKEKEIFEKRVADFCHSIGAINHNEIEAGVFKIGVYVVLDDTINQQSFIDALNKVIKLYEKTVKFLLTIF